MLRNVMWRKSISNSSSNQMMNRMTSSFKSFTLTNHRLLSSTTATTNNINTNTLKKKDARVGPGVPIDEMPFLHFKKSTTTSTTTTKRPKFESPRKRANKMYHLLHNESIATSIQNRPQVHNTPYRVGDAIEIQMISQGGVINNTSQNNSNMETIRGVVLGKVNRGLGSGVYLRDVVFGEPIDRKIALHSPLLKSITRLEENFVFKGKKKIKRAKLYYLRDRNPEVTRVTKW